MRSLAGVGLVIAVLVGACGPSGAAATPVPEPPASAVAGWVVLTAKDIAFTPTTLSMTSDNALTLVLDNQDGGIPHDVALYGAGDVKIASTDIVTGVAQAQFSIPPLIPGTYRLSCTVHPNMTATLTVMPAS